MWILQHSYKSLGVSGGVDGRGWMVGGGGGALGRMEHAPAQVGCPASTGATQWQHVHRGLIATKGREMRQH